MDLVKRNQVFMFTLLLATVMPRIEAFYVPGVAPQDFSLNDQVEVKVCRSVVVVAHS